MRSMSATRFTSGSRLTSTMHVMVSANQLLALLMTLMSMVLLVTPRLSSAIPTCPARCTCTSQSIPDLGSRKLNCVTCVNNKLTQIPTILKDGSEALMLRANKISSVDLSSAPGEGTASSLQTIQALDLSYNQVSMLNTYALHADDTGTSVNSSAMDVIDGQPESNSNTSLSSFVNMPYLRYLNLRHNRITALANETFASLEWLEVLLIDNNLLTRLHALAFSGLYNLRTLGISNNWLTAVQPTWWMHLASLNTLDMSNNQVDRLPDGAFEALVRLLDLRLDNNNLHELTRNMFAGVARLKALSLSGNQLADIPTSALTAFPAIKSLSLDNNPIKSLTAGCITQLPLSEIRLSDMAELVMIDKNAVTNMADLSLFYAHNNPRLAFLHPEAFVDVPSLQVLHIHSNKLLALPVTVIQSLPRLTHLDAHGNPLHCDCNVAWLYDVMHAYNHTGNADQQSRGRNTAVSNLASKHVIDLDDADSLVCSTPAAVRGQRVYDLHDVSHTCRPTIVPLYNSTYQIPTGSRLELICRAISSTNDVMLHWILQNGKVVNQTSNHSRVKLLHTGTLLIEYVTTGDAGRYTCVASNHAGETSSSTVVAVHNTHIHLVLTRVASTFVTVTWNASVASSKYVILYRRADDADSTAANTADSAHVADSLRSAGSLSSEQYGRVHIKPFLRGYTITSLNPKTKYELCIAYESRGEQHKINCVTIRTNERRLDSHVKRAATTRQIVILVTCLLGTAASLCVIASVINVCRHKAGYEDPQNYQTRVVKKQPGNVGKAGRWRAKAELRGFRAELSGAREGLNGPGGGARYNSTVASDINGRGEASANVRVDEMSQIPMDNFYPPPSTPLCTSTTSLISAKNA